MQDPEHQCKWCRKVWIGLEVACPYCELAATRRLKARGWPVDAMNVGLETLIMRWAQKEHND
mgnify:CR=1 FL=1